MITTVHARPQSRRVAPGSLVRQVAPTWAVVRPPRDLWRDKMPRPAPPWVLVADFVDVDLGTLEDRQGSRDPCRRAPRARWDDVDICSPTSATDRSRSPTRESSKPSASPRRRRFATMSPIESHALRETPATAERSRRCPVAAERSCVKTGSGTSSTCSRRGGTSESRVPYPVSTDRSSSVLLEYLGDDGGAAPRLAQAGLSLAAVEHAWKQLLDSLHLVVDAGVGARRPLRLQPPLVERPGVADRRASSG